MILNNIKNTMKTKVYIRFSVIVSLFFSVLSLNSCVAEDDIVVTDPTRYTANDIKTYADLFEVFWKVMDQRYNYFYEQKRNDEIDWDRIYKEYYPKFQALKTYLKKGYDDVEIQRESAIANQYFVDIIDPIIDRHFYVKIMLPSSNVSSSENIYIGGMKSKKLNVYDYSIKYNYMEYKLGADKESFSGEQGLNLFMGSLRDNPEIFYLSFNGFSLYSKMAIRLNDIYSSPSSGNKLLLTPQEIESNPELNKIVDVNLRNQVKYFTLGILNDYEAFFNSQSLKNFNASIKGFKETEILSNDFVDIAQFLKVSSLSLIDFGNPSSYGALLRPETEDFLLWFKSRMNSHTIEVYHIDNLMSAVDHIMRVAPFYQKFLNPLQRGEIKKLIIDLRSNGGGDLQDLRFLVDRFITKSAIWGYQRTKEGTGRFNYTPWIPLRINPHKFGIPSPIPIAVLIDKKTASMGEFTSLALRSQGISLFGDYSMGATAALTNSDVFNGGGAEVKVASGIFTFYLPSMATKDANGNVIEGIGIKPDYYLGAPTDTEVDEMTNSPATFIDPVLIEASKYLRSK